MVFTHLASTFAAFFLAAVALPGTALAAPGDFDDSGQAFGIGYNVSVTSGDLDGDGDLDVFVGNSGPNRVYINDGLGAMSSAMFNPAMGTVDLNKVVITGSSKIYQAQLARIPGPFVFALAGATKISATGCPAAIYYPATGVLDIPDMEIMGTTKAYAVEMTKQPGAGFVFQLTNATKQ